MTWYVKIIENSGYCIVSICDEELLGRDLRIGSYVYKIGEPFYGGEKICEIEKILNIIEKADIVNIIGERIVKELMKRGIVHEDAVIEIDGVPHTQLIKCIYNTF